MHVMDSSSQLLLEIMSDIPDPAILGSQQLRFRVEQTVPCQIWNSVQAMGDYFMSRRCNGGNSEFCSLVSRLYDRESGTKKLNGYAMTWSCFFQHRIQCDSYTKISQRKHIFKIREPLFLHR